MLPSMNALILNILVFLGILPQEEETLRREKNITPRQETPQEAPASGVACEVVPATTPVEEATESPFERAFGPGGYIDVDTQSALPDETLFGPETIRSLRVGQKIRRRAQKRGAHLITFKVHAIEGVNVWLRRPKGNLVFQAN